MSLLRKFLKFTFMMVRLFFTVARMTLNRKTPAMIERNRRMDEEYEFPLGPFGPRRCELDDLQK